MPGARPTGPIRPITYWSSIAMRQIFLAELVVLFLPSAEPRPIQLQQFLQAARRRLPEPPPVANHLPQSGPTALVGS